MEQIKKIIVSIHLAGKELEVGELVAEDRRIYFKYYVDFLEQGMEISPFKLKSADKIYSADQHPFEGLYGVFADSIPDGWGRLLLDRTLAERGIAINTISPLTRLSYVGATGMGALIYRPEVREDHLEKFTMDLDSIAKAMNHVLEGTATEILEELYSLGGSSGGARPKILIGFNPKTKHLMHGSAVLPKGYEHWIIKFPASIDSYDSAEIEFAYYKMALDAGIEMSDCRLFTGKSGKSYFGTKRFDRVKNERLHLHSAAGLMHDDFRLSNMDYGNLMDCAFQLEKHVVAYEKILRIAAFNVFAHNRDDHSKNISFLMDQKGNWKLAPAYDLTFSTSSHGWHSTMVAGESRNPGKQQLMELAKDFRVNKASQIIDQVAEAVSLWKKIGKESGVSKESQNKIQKAIRL
ncbi:MAG: type II toxin-antitoxin system HipA family toxin [Bacteroidota bacterium]|nr:type II toxin-antitoxin system HipA family toxin [Bacteroidota bacterium]